MGIYVDRVGKTYGYLTVLEKLDTKPKIKWRCRCHCGEIVEKRSDSLDNESMCKKCSNLYAKGALYSPTGKIHSSIMDERGNVYGRLTVEDLDIAANQDKNARGVLWRCRCECGKTKSVLGTQLRQGSVKSCGCLHSTLEEVGTRYGNLTITKRIENSSAGKIKYLCQCDCGTFCKVVGSDLRGGNQTSCGCVKSKGEAKIISLLRNNHINFYKEVNFDGCRDELQLPFDFKVENEDGVYLIEYDGKQHFSEEYAWSSFSFEKTKKHDEIKNEWCKQHGIPLIRIPYTHYDKLCLEDLLLNTTSFRVV